MATHRQEIQPDGPVEEINDNQFSVVSITGINWDAFGKSSNNDMGLLTETQSSDQHRVTYPQTSGVSLLHLHDHRSFDLLSPFASLVPPCTKSGDTAPDIIRPQPHLWNTSRLDHLTFTSPPIIPHDPSLTKDTIQYMGLHHPHRRLHTTQYCQVPSSSPRPCNIISHIPPTCHAAHL